MGKSKDAGWAFDVTPFLLVVPSITVIPGPGLDRFHSSLDNIDLVGWSMVVLIGISDSTNKESIEVYNEFILPLAKRRSISCLMKRINSESILCR